MEQILSQLDYNILSTLKLNGFERNEIITESWINAYREPFRTPDLCVGAIGWAKGFAEGVHRFEAADAATIKELSCKPALAIWGMADQTLRPEYFLPLFSEAFPKGYIQKAEGVGHYCHEDAPDQIRNLIKKFILQN